MSGRVEVDHGDHDGLPCREALRRELGEKANDGGAMGVSSARDLVSSYHDSICTRFKKSCVTSRCMPTRKPAPPAPEGGAI